MTNLDLDVDTNTRFFYKQRFFQLGVNELSFKCCLDFA